MLPQGLGPTVPAPEGIKPLGEQPTSLAGEVAAPRVAESAIPGAVAPETVVPNPGAEAIRPQMEAGAQPEPAPLPIESTPESVAQAEKQIESVVAPSLPQQAAALYGMERAADPAGLTSAVEAMRASALEKAGLILDPSDQ